MAVKRRCGRALERCAACCVGAAAAGAVVLFIGSRHRPDLDYQQLGSPGRMVRNGRTGATGRSGLRVRSAAAHRVMPAALSVVGATPISRHAA